MKLKKLFFALLEFLLGKKFRVKVKPLIVEDRVYMIKYSNSYGVFWTTLCSLNMKGDGYNLKFEPYYYKVVFLGFETTVEYAKTLTLEGIKNSEKEDKGKLKNYHQERRNKFNAKNKSIVIS